MRKKKTMTPEPEPVTLDAYAIWIPGANRGAGGYSPATGPASIYLRRSDAMDYKRHLASYHIACKVVKVDVSLTPKGWAA